MYDLKWDIGDGPQATAEQLDKVEAALSVKIPSILKQIWTTYGSIGPSRNGERASVLVRTDSDTGMMELVGYFAAFVSPEADCPSLNWLEENFNYRPKTAIEFGTDGGSSIYLVYDNDSTKENPEIWDLYTENDTLDSAWRCLAIDAEEFFSNLKTESEARVHFGVRSFIATMLQRKT